MHHLFIPYFNMAKFTKEKNQETILAIVLGLLVIWFFTKIQVLLVVSLCLVIVGLFSQWVSGWITFLWLKLSHVMGYVMSRVILSAIFFLFLFPIALLSRLFKKDLMQLKKTKGTSYYHERNHQYLKDDLENPW